jgi:hypothetical protein
MDKVSDSMVIPRSSQLKRSSSVSRSIKPGTVNPQYNFQGPNPIPGVSLGDKPLQGRNAQPTRSRRQSLPSPLTD